MVYDPTTDAFPSPLLTLFLFLCWFYKNKRNEWLRSEEKEWCCTHNIYDLTEGVLEQAPDTDTFCMIPFTWSYRQQNRSVMTKLRTLATCGGYWLGRGKKEPSGELEKCWILIWVVTQLYPYGCLRFIHFFLSSTEKENKPKIILEKNSSNRSTLLWRYSIKFA